MVKTLFKPFFQTTIALAFSFLISLPQARGQECTTPDEPCDDHNECTTEDKCICTLRPPPEDFEVEGGVEAPSGECACVGNPIPDCHAHPEEPPPSDDPFEEGGQPPPPDAIPQEGAPSEDLPPEPVPSPPEPVKPSPIPIPTQPPSEVRLEPPSLNSETKGLFICFSDAEEAIDLSTCQTTPLAQACPTVEVDEAMTVMAKGIQEAFKNFKKDLSRKKCAKLRRQVARYIEGFPAKEAPSMVALSLSDKNSKASYKSVPKENLPSFSTCLKTGDMILNDDKAVLKINGLAATEKPSLVIANPGAGGCSLVL